MAFDVVGLLPVFWSIAQGLSSHQRQRAVHQAVTVALFVAWGFLVISKSVFVALGIQMADLMVAGGVILFVLALSDLLHPEKTPYTSTEAIGVVPLGVPLIVGPAVLTTMLLVRERHGAWLTMAALGCNILLTWLVLLAAERLMGWLGRQGAAVISKVSSLVLAAFAVMLVRQGLLTGFWVR